MVAQSVAGQIVEGAPGAPGQTTNPILAFWTASILTHPFGASFADWAGKSPSLSGLGLGTGEVSVVLTILIVILVGYLTVTRKDVGGEGW